MHEKKAIQAQAQDASPAQGEVTSAARQDIEAAETTILSNEIVIKSVWFFIIGSIAGAVIETIWRVVVYRELVYRSALVLSPLLIVYGLGTVSLYLGKKFVRNNKLLMFVYGTAMCAAIEYFTSLFQELAFGTISWDYSNHSLNLGGRINMTLAIAWGVLSVIWYIAVMPGCEKLLDKIPARANRRIICALAIFFLIDVTVTICAVSRWHMRIDGIPPSNALTAAFDGIFHDEYMETVFASMVRLR